MSDQVLEIYQTIAQAVSDSIPEEWERAIMVFEKQEGMVKSSVGFYCDETSYLKPFTIKNEIRKKATRGIYDLHAITTAGGNNRWNFLWFALFPSGAYEIDFIWNQDEEDKLDHLAQTQDFPRPDRSADFRAFKLAQAERRSPALYDTLVREVIKLIPEEWVSASVTLREAGIGIIEHGAHYRSPTETEDDALNITYSWAVLFAVEELRRLKKSGGHPDWQEVTFTIEAAGSYRAAFTTQPASGSKPAEGYFYDGQWQNPPASLPASIE